MTDVSWLLKPRHEMAMETMEGDFVVNEEAILHPSSPIQQALARMEQRGKQPCETHVAQHRNNKSPHGALNDGK